MSKHAEMAQYSAAVSPPPVVSVHQFTLNPFIHKDLSTRDARTRCHMKYIQRYFRIKYCGLIFLTVACGAERQYSFVVLLSPVYNSLLSYSNYISNYIYVYNIHLYHSVVSLHNIQYWKTFYSYVSIICTCISQNTYTTYSTYVLVKKP